MPPVQVKDIPVGGAFLMTWRPEEAQAGKVIGVSWGSVRVHIPKQKDDTWEWDYTNIAGSTLVEPCDLSRYTSQGFGATGSSRLENRSKVESPVELVHRLCDEMDGATRDEIVKAAVDQGVNINTAKTQFYAWRKKNR